MTVPLGSVSSAFFALVLPFICLFAVKPLIRRRRPSSIGLLLLALALFSGSELDESSSMGGGDVTSRCLRLAERVTGPKYPSFPLVSEGVGEGDMTRGV